MGFFYGFFVKHYIYSHFTDKKVGFTEKICVLSIH